MARPRIGQERCGFMGRAGGGSAALEELAGTVDWAAIERLLEGISAAAKGEPAWPPLALFKALLLGPWHDRSDVNLAEAPDDRRSFRRFSGFAESEAVPECTACCASGVSWCGGVWRVRCSGKCRASSMRGVGAEDKDARRPRPPG